MSGASASDNSGPSLSSRRYYSMRKGTNPYAAGLDLNTLKQLFHDTYEYFVSKDYFQQAFGYDCVDQGWVPGILGSHIEAQFRLHLRKDSLWPIDEKCQDYSEDDLFDIIEFLHDQVSLPVGGYFHSYMGCGMHYDTFDKAPGQLEYRQRVNAFLRDYGEGYELSEDGEILNLAPSGMASLVDATLPSDDHENVSNRVVEATRKFRHRSTLDDRRDAIRDLADVLEYLRPKLKGAISSKDENDLFNLANSFGIRHHNDRQKTDYDRAIWYSWMFYYYLATIHAAARLIEKDEQGAGDGRSSRIVHRE